LTEPQGMAALSPRSGGGWENDIGGRGYAREAVAAMIAYGFQTLGFEMVASFLLLPRGATIAKVSDDHCVNCTNPLITAGAIRAANSFIYRGEFRPLPARGPSDR